MRCDAAASSQNNSSLDRFSTVSLTLLLAFGILLYQPHRPAFYGEYCCITRLRAFSIYLDIARFPQHEFLTICLIVYVQFSAEILRNKLAANPDIKVWLINTGWAGGPPGRGSRFELSITRKCVDACVNNQVDDKYVADPVFNLSVPEKVPGLPSHVLNPRLAWACDKEYEKASKALAALFRENWRKEGHPENLAKYGPC